MLEVRFVLGVAASFMDMLKENLVFFREFLLEFKTTGAFFPTSRWAAEAMTRFLRHRGRKPYKILELGPGTGSVTVKILEDMLPDDRLTVCEINPRFMEALQARLAPTQNFIRNRDRISFFLGPVQDLPEDIEYDVIVCAIPFLNLDAPTVQEIFTKLRKVSSPDTLMTYYEYIGLKRLGIAVSPPERKKRLEEIDSLMARESIKSRLGIERVWRNVLPIKVFTVKPAA